jgi:single stranded DNA-binding protein
VIRKRATLAADRPCVILQWPRMKPLKTRAVSGKSAPNGTELFAQQYLKKGQEVYVEGSIRTNEWTDKENQKRTTVEIIASDFRFVGSKQESGGSSYRSPAASSSSSFDSGTSSSMEHDQSGPEVTDEDIPF